MQILSAIFSSCVALALLESAWRWRGNKPFGLWTAFLSLAQLATVWSLPISALAYVRGFRAIAQEGRGGLSAVALYCAHVLEPLRAASIVGADPDFVADLTRPPWRYGGWPGTGSQRG
jgi:hypothetical protein